MSTPPPPFSCAHSPNVPELLHQLKATIAISTYQAGKLVFLSAPSPDRLTQLPRTFPKPMGIALKENMMAIAVKDEVVVLANDKRLAANYPAKPNTYDALYVPRAKYYTGQIDIHDLDWGEDGLYAVNTSFSCIVKIDHEFSYRPYWVPSFISKLAAEDRCHLNGMAMKDGYPKYATAFNQGDQHQSWRPEVTKAGVLFDIKQSEPICTALPMPHSPRIWDNQLYLLLSATGELVRIDLDKGSYDVICQLDGFVRGMSKIGDYAFIGLSKVRKQSTTFSQLKIADKATSSGIAIIHLPTGSKVGIIQYLSSVEEIYDVQILPNLLRPGILNTTRPEYKLALSTPETSYWAKTKES